MRWLKITQILGRRQSCNRKSGPEGSAGLLTLLQSSQVEQHPAASFSPTQSCSEETTTHKTDRLNWCQNLGEQKELLFNASFDLPSSAFSHLLLRKSPALSSPVVPPQGLIPFCSVDLRLWTSDSTWNPQLTLGRSVLLSRDYADRAAKEDSVEDLAEDKLAEPKTEAENFLSESSSGSGWTRKEVANWPNGISMARMLSGPLLAGLILQGEAAWALAGLVVAGASDWLDGYIAKHYDQNSVLGSYLDPLADKVLMVSVVGALAWKSLLPLWLVGLTIGRDVLLVLAAFYWRAQSLDWQWKGAGQFFKLGEGGAMRVEPIFISKVNTVFQLMLVASALSYSAWGIPARPGLQALGYLVGFTTVLSSVGYARQYINRPLLDKVRVLSSRDVSGKKDAVEHGIRTKNKSD